MGQLISYEKDHPAYDPETRAWYSQYVVSATYPACDIAKRGTS